MVARFWQLARFCSVGALCAGLGLAILAGLHELAGVNYLAAFAVAFVISNAVGYRLNARFTFAADRVDATGIARYMLINLASLLINSIALRVLVGNLHLWYLAASLLLTVVNAPIAFVAHRLLSYREAREPSGT